MTDQLYNLNNGSYENSITLHESDFQISKSFEEITTHGRPEFPLASYKVQLSKYILGKTPLHWHTEIQFIVVVSGDVCIYVNDNNYYLTEGEGIFINSGCMHFAQKNISKDCIYHSFDISPYFYAPKDHLIYKKYFAPFFFDSKISAITLSHNVDWQKNILKDLSHLFSESKDFFYELHLYNIHTIIIKTLIKNTWDMNSHSINSYTDNTELKAMINYIQDNYATKITLDDISKSGHTNRSQCCKLFKFALNMSPFEYLIHYRISKSIILLRTTHLSITEISLEVGFNSTSYFIETFRNLTDYTPNKYRVISQR